MENRNVCVPEDERVRIKCVLVGDGAVGKTCMLFSYAKGTFPTDYFPTSFEDYSANINIGGQTCQLILVDTAGQEEFETLRKFAYVDTDIFLICFNVVEPISFSNIREVWIKEIKKSNKKTPIVIVGTKTDLRETSKTKPVTKEEGEKLASKLKVHKYVECSALTRDGLKGVFDEAIIAVLNKKAKSKKSSGRCALI